MMIQIRKAEQEDAQALMVVSRDAFDGDINYGAPEAGGPPGYASENWHLRMILNCDVYKIVHFDRLSERIVGGIVVYEKEPQHMELGRMWVHPDYQNQGIGGQAIQFLEDMYPDAKLWTLDTPKWNTRNHHFYQKMGYELTGEEGEGGLWFAKQILVHEEMSTKR